MARLRLSLALLGCLLLGGVPDVLAMPSPMEAGQAPLATGAPFAPARLAQAQPAQAPAPAAAPLAAPAAADQPVGNVATLTGSATVTRNNTSSELKLRDDIFQNDLLQTSANSTLGVTFNDATTFNLTANASMTVDYYVYEEGGKENVGLFNIARGTVAFAAADVARTGDMQISTPTVTVGIRGATGLVEVPEAAAGAANNVAIKLYPDADGRVGRIEVNDRSAAQLGLLTQGSSGFTIRPDAGGRLTALPLAISQQQALQDQGFVRQVHATQSLGRQIIPQRGIQPPQNPSQNNPERQPVPVRQPAPARQPAPQRQNALPQRPGSPPKPGLPNRTGPRQLQRPGLQRQPKGPVVLRPGLQTRALQKPRPAAPKGKTRKERR